MLSVISQNISSNTILDKKPFDTLAYAQRGEPEAAMLKIQSSQICQLYGWICEHVGDLTHRMSEHIDWSRGGYEYVSEKVNKTLRTLMNSPKSNGMMRFEDDVMQQIKSNVNFFKENPQHGNGYQSPEEAYAKLKELGMEYAEAHRSLPTFNEVQKIAQNAAISVGEFNFSAAKSYLMQLQKCLQKGPEFWEAKATENSNAPRNSDLDSAFNAMQRTTEQENEALEQIVQNFRKRNRTMTGQQ